MLTDADWPASCTRGCHHHGDDARIDPGDHGTGPFRRTCRTGPRTGEPHTAGTFDVRARGGAAVAPNARTARARLALARRLGTQGVVQSDPMTGTLRMVGRLDGYLTARSGRPARTVAMGFVRSNLAAFGLTNADIKTFRLRQDYVDIAGVHHLSWTQSKRGIQVFHNGLRASVTADGRLVNVTGSPVHAIRVASTVPRIGSAAAIGAARADGGARVAAAQRSDRASLVLFPTGRGARLAWKTFTWPSTQQLNLSVVDAATGAVLYRQSLSSDATGTATAWDFYPSDLVPVGGEHRQSGHVPGGRRLASVRPQRARVGRCQGQQQARRRRRGLRRVGNGLEHARDPEHVEFRAGLHHVASVHVGQEHAVQLAGEPGAERRAGHVLPEQVPRPPRQRAVRIHRRGRQLRETADRVLGQAMDGANSGNGLPDENHFNNANMGTPPDGHSPTMQMYLFHAEQGSRSRA